MANKIQIIMTTGTDTEGVGGTVVDDSSAVMPDGVIDSLADAFEDAYGRHSDPNPDYDPAQPEDENNPQTIPLSKYQSVSRQIRVYAELILRAAIKKEEDATAKTNTNSRFDAVKNEVKIK
jgi:hypothetical protein